jgi:hypothetical protein
MPLSAILILFISGCPWLNNATAAGILGDLTTANACDFTSQNGSLHIATEPLTSDFANYIAAHCKSEPIKLKAIGTEAVSCSNGPSTERIVGRVRNQGFIVLLTTTGTPDERREKARKVAGQVAGALF